MRWFDSIGPLSGRILISAIFILSGLMKIASFDATQAYMAQHGMQATELFLTAAIVIELVGGFSLLFGLATAAGALLLAAFLVPVTLIFHGFWNYVGAEQQMQMANFLKNVAIMGGLLYIASRPADVYSLDARLHLTRRLRRRPISTRRV